MREYLMGVICAAFLSSIVNAIGDQSRPQRKLICGVFLALSLLHPLGSLELPELSAEPFLQQAQTAVLEGTQQANAARTDIISDALEAYILTEAARHGLALQVHVTVDDEGLPTGVTITGAASPSEREALTGILEKDLGIGKEDLYWTSFPQGDE